MLLAYMLMRNSLPRRETDLSSRWPTKAYGQLTVHTSDEASELNDLNDLVGKLIAYDPEKRGTIDELVSHHVVEEYTAKIKAHFLKPSAWGLNIQQLLSSADRKKVKGIIEAHQETTANLVVHNKQNKLTQRHTF